MNTQTDHVDAPKNYDVQAQTGERLGQVERVVVDRTTGVPVSVHVADADNHFMVPAHLLKREGDQVRCSANPELLNGSTIFVEEVDDVQELEQVNKLYRHYNAEPAYADGVYQYAQHDGLNELRDHLGMRDGIFHSRIESAGIGRPSDRLIDAKNRRTFSHSLR